MPARAVRDVVFDLGGVLVDWDPRYLYCGHLGEDATEVEAFLREVCTPAWHARIDRGTSFDEAAGELAARFPSRAGWISLYAREWERMFRAEHGETVTCLRELGRRGYRLHALSNYPAQKIAFLYRAYPFMSEFHSVVLSGLVRVMKPERAIFEYLARVLGGRPCVFIDDRTENVEAARRCGITAVRFVPGEGAALLAELEAAGVA